MAIASCLVDSNVLLRLALRDSPDHQVVRTAVTKLQGANAVLFFTHQNISEFWNVATRPKEQTGFGLSVAEVNTEVQSIERGWVFLPTARPSIASGAESLLSTRFEACRYMMPVWQQLC